MRNSFVFFEVIATSRESTSCQRVPPLAGDERAREGARLVLAELELGQQRPEQLRRQHLLAEFEALGSAVL